MTEQRTPEERAGMSDREIECFPNLTKRELHRRVWVWSTALVLVMVVIVVMSIVS